MGLGIELGSAASQVQQALRRRKHSPEPFVALGKLAKLFAANLVDVS
jgi:hypothetical protein